MNGFVPVTENFKIDINSQGSQFLSHSVGFTIFNHSVITSSLLRSFTILILLGEFLTSSMEYARFSPILGIGFPLLDVD